MGFELRHIFSSPFWLASLGIGFGGWVVAVVGTAFAGGNSFAIWEAVFMLIPFLATLFAVGTDSIGAYRLALMPFYVIGIIYATMTANEALQFNQTAEVILAVGLLVVSVTFFLWIIVAGVDRFLAGTGLSAGGMYVASKRQMPPMYAIPQMSSNRSVSSQKATASVSVTATPQITASTSGQQQPPNSSGGQRPSTSESQKSDGKPKEPDTGTITGVHVDVAPDVVYEYKAQALYAYTASVDDPNELSFAKGELMEIVDNQGKWWQARKADGSIGIVPSNYMKLLQ
jgi:SHO1 osmosensor